jgi:hypothetical protein
LTLDTLYENYKDAVDKTASHPLPEDFSRENIGDFYKLKVGKVRQMSTQHYRMMELSSQEMTNES